MLTMPMRIFLILTIIAFFYPSLSPAAAEQRIALVIGNSAYSSGPLKNPVNDAADIAAALQRLGFKVNLKKNADLETMEEAVEDFGKRLKKGGVGLFYYAGHGVQVNGINYLIPVNAKINKESDVRFKAFDAGRILAEMENADNSLNIVLLDACRDNPFGKSFRSATRGLAIVSSSPSGTFISFSTAPGQVAKDGEGRNSPYTKALLENMVKPGLTINKVFMNVRSKVKKETGQIPWELSSLEGDFFFVPAGAGKASTVRDDISAEKSSAADELNEENRKLEAERRRQDAEKESFAKKKALDEKRRRIEEERKRYISPVSETGRDRQFIAYSNGTVLDTETNLMWAAKDNRININWSDAKNYCESYRGGGYTDWRMPTQDELVGLYDGTIKNTNSPTEGCSCAYYLTNLIRLSCCCLWASETRGSDAAYFSFTLGRRFWFPPSLSNTFRVLPVRSAK